MRAIGERTRAGKRYFVGGLRYEREDPVHYCVDTSGRDTAIGTAMGCVSVDTGIRDFCIDVRSRDILTMSGDGENKIHKEYYLYIGRDKHEQSNRYVQLVSNTERELLIHPVPAVAMQYEAPERWYLRHLYTLNKRPFGDPLLTEGIWASISPLAKYIMKAFDPGDLDLVLIFIDTYPESISVFYHVKHSENREFYEKKAELLRAYFSEHDYRRDILLEEIIGKQHLDLKRGNSQRVFR